mmetsp:Transcript_98082/g.302425  ORF Transcript_98082/g.302425 Transcript_98082/m.302425 type:complete len:83 (+) Transcript_98082:398-646(+)
MATSPKPRRQIAQRLASGCQDLNFPGRLGTTGVPGGVLHGVVGGAELQGVPGEPGEPQSVSAVPRLSTAGATTRAPAALPSP